MKKIEKPQTEKLRPIRIFHEDIAAIFSYCNQQCKSVDLVIDDYKLNNPSEINLLEKDRANKLRIEGFDPRVLVELNDTDATIWIGDSDNVVLQGIKMSVIQTLYKRPRLIRSVLWAHFVSRHWVSLLGLSLVFMFITRWSPIGIISPATMVANGLRIPELVILIAVLMAIIDFILYSQKSTRFSDIQLLHFTKRSTFWKRNKDAIIVNLFVAIVSVVLTLVTQSLLNSKVGSHGETAFSSSSLPSDVTPKR